MMIAERKRILLIALAGAALVGLVTNRFMAGGTRSPGQVIPAFAEPQPRADHHIAGASPSLPLSMEERDGAYTAEGGENHRRTQDLIMGWRREGRALLAEDAKELLSFLGQGQPEGLASGEWEERVNEILNLLRSQSGEVTGLAETMLKMAAEDPNPILRMYALQHIAMWIPDEPSAESREAMIDHLRKLSLLPNDPLAGSAVLFLSDLERGGSIANRRPEIAETALRIASDATASPDVRIAALHACVDQGVGEGMANRRPEIAATARLIAADTSLMIPLRKAAIHTIGMFGTQEDVKLLEPLSEQAPALADAISPAIGKLGKEEAD
jgi:hypothetical protein